MVRIEILTIGDELVEGRLVDSNSAMLSDRLHLQGLPATAHLSVADDRAEIVAALHAAAARCSAVLVSGGLGPTEDDLTAACAAEAFGRPLVRFPEALEHTRSFWVSRGREMPPNNEKQADLPEASTILANPWGTAVGFVLDHAGCRLYFMPGVPREIEGIFDQSVLPELTARYQVPPPRVATLKVFGLGESDVAQRLGDFSTTPGLKIQYRATFPEIHVRLVLPGDGDQTVLNTLLAAAHQRLGQHVFATGDGLLATSFGDAVVKVLLKRSKTVAVAEGFTQGRAARMLAAAADADRFFAGGVVATTDSSRQQLLGLEPGSSQGSELVEAMAAAVRERTGADLGVAAHGFSRAKDGRPDSTLWVAVHDGREATGRTLSFGFDDARMRKLGAWVALEQLRRLP